MRIIGLGNALVDVITHLDQDSYLEEFRLPKGSMTLVDEDQSAMVRHSLKHLPSSLASGGSAANTIYGLSRLGISCGFAGSIGKDELGSLFRKDLEEAGVETHLMDARRDTGCAVSLVSPDSERTFATYLGAALEMDASWLDTIDFRSYDLIYIEGYLLANEALVRAAMRKARENKLVIALDMASYNIVQEYLPLYKSVIPAYVDLLFANEEEATVYTDRSDPHQAAAMLAEEVQTAVVKTGPQGSVICRGGDQWDVDACPAGRLDTTGAGDLYAAGYLAGYSREWLPELCGKLGSLVAASVIEINGARIPDKKWPGIVSAMESMG